MATTTLKDVAAAAELIASIEDKRQPQGKILPTRYIPRMSTAHEVQGENT